MLQFAATNAVPGGTGSITINLGGALGVSAPYGSVNAWLATGTIATGSSGAVALTASTAEPIGMAGYNSLSLARIGSVTYSGVLTPAASGYFLGGGGGTLTFAPALTGGNGLTVSGPGSVVLTASNSYSGNTTVNSGLLQLNASGGASIPGPLFVSGGTVQLLQANQIAAGQNATVSAGVLNLQSCNQSVAGLTLSGGSVQGSGTLTSLATINAQSGTIAAGLAGTGGLSKTGAGTVVLSGAGIAYSGSTAISAGLLKLVDATALVTSIANSGALELNGNSGVWTWGQPIAGNGTFTKSGAGTVVLTGGLGGGTINARAAR